MKKIYLVIVFLLLFSFSFFNDKKVSGQLVSISTSAVNYDLRVFHGGENWQSYDLSNLYPTAGEDEDFKFLLMKPIDQSIYLYAFADNISKISDSTIMRLKISTSKTNTADGIFVENFVEHTARFLNSYGTQQRFYKFVIDGVNFSDDNRLFISEARIDYGTTNSTGWKAVNHELVFNATSEDLIYEYLTDDVLVITDSTVGMFIVFDPLNIVGQTVGASEQFFYFFDTDIEFDSIKQIKYDFELMEYSTVFAYQPQNHYGGLYGGLYSDACKGVAGCKSMKIRSITPYYNQIVEPEEKVVDWHSSFLWWKWGLKYDYSTIIDISKTAEIEDNVFRTFIEKASKKDDGTFYQWAFNVVNSARLSFGVYNHWYWSWGLPYVEKRINSVNREVLQTLVTRITYTKDNQDFDLNVLSEPKDTEFVIVNTIPFPTFVDVVFDSINDLRIDIFDGFKSLFSNFRTLIIIFVAIILIWIVIKVFSILRVLLFPVTYTTKKISNRRKRNK